MYFLSVVVVVAVILRLKLSKLTTLSDNAYMNLLRKTCSSSEPCLQSGQSNLRKMQHRRRTWTIQSYSPSCANVHSHLTHAFLNPPESTTQTASRSVQPFLQGSLVWQTDRQTDHATRSVTICRIYVRSTAMRPNNSTRHHVLFIMAALYNRGAIIFLPCSFFLLSIYMYLSIFFPRLISAAAGWMSTILWHMVWP